MNNFSDQILSVFAPHICKDCGKVGRALCESCFFDIMEKTYEKCINCEASISQKTFAKNGNMCENCARKLPFAKIFVVGERTGALLRLVDEYKYNSERADAKIFAKLLDKTVPELAPDTVVTFVTTSAPHIRERGFDHMALAAKNFAKLRKLRCQKLLFRENSDSQHDKKARERKILAKKMFSTRRRIPENVLLLDDIWTTGATTIAAAKLLRESGAKNVQLAIVAKQTGLKHRDLSRKLAEKLVK